MLWEGCCQITLDPRLGVQIGELTGIYQDIQAKTVKEPFKRFCDLVRAEITITTVLDDLTAQKIGRLPAFCVDLRNDLAVRRAITRLSRKRCPDS